MVSEDDFKLAMEHLRQAYLDGDYVKRNYHLGTGLYLLELYSASFPFLKEAAARDPMNEKLLCNFGNVSIQEKKYEEAIGILEQVLKIIPTERIEVLKNLGTCYSELNQPKKAIPYFKKVFEISPEDLDTLVGLVDMYAKMGDIHSALS